MKSPRSPFARRVARIGRAVCACTLIALGMFCPALALAQGAPPDYRQPQAWAAYPDRPSHADDRPAGVAARTTAPAADVFFIHPTTYLRSVVGNAPFDGPALARAWIDDAVLPLQASVFNGCCRIFAPRYRQASITAIIGDSGADHAAAALAYADVERAFDRFIADIPANRPFIIAGHSQGSIHAIRLLQQRVIGTPLQKRLVAAYLPGAALPRAIEQLGLPICRSAAATGCVVTWNSVRTGHDDKRRLQDAQVWWQGRYQRIGGRPIVCVNPLNWQLDGDAPASDNLGAVYRSGHGGPIPAPLPQLTGAVCQRGLLGVSPRTDESRHFSDLLTLGGVYHDFDYGLFYMNIRANAELRVGAYLAAH